MDGYFKPLRRKVGLVTLALALVSMAAWNHTILMFGLLNLSSDGPMPYSFIAISLTVVSVWLLLSTPRSAQRETVLPE